MRAARALLVDVTPLRTSAPFRRLWAGSTLSAVGSQMTTFAVALQAYQLTHSSAAVGATGLVAAVPAVSFGLFAGSIVDSFDRRRLVLITSSLLALVSAGFAAQAFADFGSLWLIYVLVALQSLLGSINAPARRTFLPRLLPAGQVPAGIALTMLTFHASLLLGPVAAGSLAAAGGLRLCYLVDAVSFVGSLYGVARLPAMRPEGTSSRPGPRAVLAGLRFIRHNQILTGALLADVNATVLAMPIALFPAVNAERFGGSPRTLGFLTAAVAVGGLLGAGLSGPVGRLTRPGRGMLVAGAVWGLALAGFGAVHSLGATLGCLVLAGAADSSSVVLRSTIIQLATPDEYRGRVSAAEFVAGGSMPQLGNFRAGLVASASTPSVSAVSGGLSAALGSALLGLALPLFARHTSHRAADARAVQEAAAAPG